jgi:hypothetical protein
VVVVDDDLCGLRRLSGGFGPAEIGEGGDSAEEHPRDRREQAVEGCFLHGCGGGGCGGVCDVGVLRLDFRQRVLCCVWPACYCECARIANSESGGRSRCISLWGNEVK